jgi:hypothetical protein
VVAVAVLILALILRLRWKTRPLRAVDPQLDELARHVEDQRKVLNARAASLLNCPTPNDKASAVCQLNGCGTLVREIYTLQYDIERIVELDGSTEGRYRAAAVAELAEGAVCLQEAVIRMHLHALELKDDPKALMSAKGDELGAEALRRGLRAIDRARRDIVEISTTRQRAKRFARTIPIVLGLRRREIDDIGASDLEMHCDQVEAVISSLADSVGDEINDKLSERLSLLSNTAYPERATMELVHSIIDACLTDGRAPEDRSHPLLRIRLLEMLNRLTDLPRDWSNLRWTALLFAYLGWIELFAAHACRSGDEQHKVQVHVQHARNFCQSARVWATESQLHRRWDIRLQKVLSGAGLDRRVFEWGQPPTELQLDRCVRGLVRNLTELSVHVI